MATVDPLVGTTVAHYEVQARLGGGGMGIVYAARDTKLGRRVALKFLPPQWSHDESAKQRFIREAQAASATDHPNICTIHDIETAGGGQLFIVMARYDGETLKERLERGPLPIDDAIEITAQVAEGLAKAHAQGVVHRDIKPGNLMLTDDGVRILDFGLAKFADVRFKLTLEGSTIGTIVYMSPEQARGEEADVRSDVWAVGVVLYEMLAGEAPFKGAYPEAISHAIRNDPPPPLRAKRPDVPEALEQLVFRALHKEPAIRFQTARDMARALRQLQGRSLPLDLRTEPISAPAPPAAATARSRSWRSGRAASAAIATAALGIGAPLWVLSPTERTAVAVTPVVNQTGFTELDGYRLALTQELTREIEDAPGIRTIDYERLLPALRQFRGAGRDVSSRQALSAIATSSGAAVVLVPTLLYDNGNWKARVEIRNADTDVNDASYDTDGVVSSLPKETAHQLVDALAARVHDHFVNLSRRTAAAESLRRLFGRGATASPPVFGNLDGAASFERGTDAYSQQEYAAALAAFTTAAAAEPRNPLVQAWRSRAAHLARQDADAINAGTEAVRLLTPQTPMRVRLFVEGVAAEAQKDLTTAEARYANLVAQLPDEPSWLVELARFRDRTATNATATSAAISTYLDALKKDPRQLGAELELCRLYGPARENERVQAREHGQRALAGYRALGDRNGEALSLICLTEVLRVGTADERREARQDGEMARDILKSIGSTYSLPRAELALALGTAAQGDMPGASALFQQALDSARRGQNRILEPILLMNLGVADVRLGKRADAAAHYKESAALYDALGDEQRGAQQQANSAALLIEYGDMPADGLREMQNALAVSQKLGDKNFEAFCLQVIAAYYRQVGRHDEAERSLNQALAILRERNLEDDIASVTTDLARSQFDRGAYDTASKLLTEALGDGTGPSAAAAQIHRARVRVQQHDLQGATADLASTPVQSVDAANELYPLLQLARGELAYAAGQPAAARGAFATGAALWTSSLPDASSVEARAWVGFLDAMNGQPRGRAAIQASLDQAERMGRVAIVARCREFLARLDRARAQRGSRQP